MKKQIFAMACITSLIVGASLIPVITGEQSTHKIPAPVGPFPSEPWDKQWEGDTRPMPWPPAAHNYTPDMPNIYVGK